MIKYFPVGYNPTAKQKSILDLIESKLKTSKKFIVIHAPTGSGKSFLAKTIANTTRKACSKYINLVKSGDIYKTNSTNDSFISSDQIYNIPAHGCYSLTITKTLQDQYKSLFDDTAVWKGRTNYTCNIDNNFDADNAPCIFSSKQLKTCLEEKCCDYYNRRDDLLINQFGSLSYSKFLSMEDHLKRRQILVLDEASELEFELVKEFTFTLPHKELSSKGIVFNFSTNRDNIYNSLIECYKDLKIHLENIKNLINKRTKIQGSDNNLLREFKKLNNISLGLKTLISTFKESKYIIERTNLETIFTPLKVDVLSKHIFDHAEKVILMSATIVGIRNFMKSLGISSDNYEYLDIESSFDPKKSPIKVCRDMPLNARNLNLMLPKIVHTIEQILDIHPNEKGIIHTQSNNITEYISNYIKDIYKDRLLVREPGVRNENILEEHKNSKLPSVLVSPSMAFGVDLKDDLGRFQIVVKLPYLPWNDKRAEQIRKTDEKWYTYKMLSNLIQACGRTTRGEDDYSVTYILDSNFLRILNIYKSDIPNYFLNRL